MKREYGIDILKAAAMSMVVCFHIMGRGGVLEATVEQAGTRTVEYGVVRLFHTFCLCAVNCFVK